MKTPLVGALIGVLMAMQSATAASLSGRLEVRPSDPNFPGPFVEQVQQAAPIYFSGIAGGSMGSEGNGSVAVDYGVLKLGGHFTGAGSTQSRASFSDALTFNVPGRPAGTRILVTFEVMVTGSLQVGPAPGQSMAQAGWELNANLGSLPHDNHPISDSVQRVDQVAALSNRAVPGRRLRDL